MLTNVIQWMRPVGLGRTWAPGAASSSTSSFSSRPSDHPQVQRTPVPEVESATITVRTVYVSADANPVDFVAVQR